MTRAASERPDQPRSRPSPGLISLKVRDFLSARLVHDVVLKTVAVEGLDQDRQLFWIGSSDEEGSPPPLTQPLSGNAAGGELPNEIDGRGDERRTVVPTVL